MKPGELQTAIIIPKEAYEGYFGHYIKYAMRNAMDIATTGCSVNVKLSEDKKTILDARIAYGVAVRYRCVPLPRKQRSVEKRRAERQSKSLPRQFLRISIRGTAGEAAKDFREHIATVLAERALCESIRLAGGEVHE